MTTDKPFIVRPSDHPVMGEVAMDMIRRAILLRVYRSKKTNDAYWISQVDYYTDLGFVCHALNLTKRNFDDLKLDDMRYLVDIDRNKQLSRPEHLYMFKGLDGFLLLPNANGEKNDN